MMNPEAQAELDRIVQIEPEALSEADISFLRARRSYLTEEQKAVYAEVLESSVEAVSEPEAEAAQVEEAPVEVTEDVPAPAKKSKK